MRPSHLRQRNNYATTIEQISRIERALLHTVEMTDASSDLLHTVAESYYQEITMLRAELDSRLGFAARRTSDLVVSLYGPRIQLGTVSLGTLWSALDNIRDAMRSVAGYLAFGHTRSGGGRYPTWMSEAADFRLAGIGVGSVKIQLDLPDDRAVSNDDGTDLAIQSARLLLDTVSWCQSSSSVDEFLKSIESRELAQLLLDKIARIAPSRYGSVDRVEFSGLLVTSDFNHRLEESSRVRITQAIRDISEHESSVEEEGVIRAVDKDRYVVKLKPISESKPTLTCEITPTMLPEALGYLINDRAVRIRGAVLRHDRRGRPTRLSARDFQDLGPIRFLGL